MIRHLSRYFGANSSPNITTAGFKWAHWLTNDYSHHHHSELEPRLSDTFESSSSSPPNAHPAPRTERAAMSHQSYPWSLLNHTSPYTIRFNSSGTYHSYVLRTSLSGLPDAGHLKVSLDGVNLGWTPREEVGLDRWFYDFVSKEEGSTSEAGRQAVARLEEGEHVLEFELGEEADERVAQLCSAEVLEYGSPEE